MKKEVIIMAGLCLLLGIGIMFLWNRQDRVPPTITVPDTSIKYVEGDVDSMLKGVEAYDDRDGDVSNSLYVKISNDEKGEVYVTYYAKDNSNNVSRITKKVEVVEEAEVAKIEATPKATPTIVPATQEVAPTDIPVTSETPVATEEATENPQIILKEERIVIARGDEINRLLYVADIIDDKDPREELFNHIQINGEVDSDVPDEYELIYHVVDSDGNRSNEAKLTVVVQ